MLGHFTRSDTDHTVGMLSSGLQMSKSLGLPPNLKVLLRSGSTLTVHGTDTGAAEGLDKRKRNLMYDLKWAHKKYEWDAAILDGQTLTDLHTSLPKDPQEISAFDVTVIVCNVTAPRGSNAHSAFAPGGVQGIAMVRLCKELLAHRRPLLVVGGDGLPVGHAR